MLPPPETTRVTQPRVACDGATDIPGGAALGHPRVWLQIDDTGYVDCGYCDRRFVLAGGPGGWCGSIDFDRSRGWRGALRRLYPGT